MSRFLLVPAAVAVFLAACAPPPDAPGDFTATAVGPLTVRFGWTDASDDESGFRIEARLDGGTAFAAVATTSADETSFDLPVAPGTTYHARLCAFNAGGDSAYTAEADAVTPGEPVALPGTFPQKVLIEEITGTWCGYCPDGAWRLQQQVDAHPGLVYGAAHHSYDLLSYGTTLYTEYLGGLGNPLSVPYGAVNRLPTGSDVFVSRAAWAGKVNAILATSATDLGLRVRTVRIGDRAVIVATAGFQADRSAQALRVTVIVTEDDVTGYPQTNYDDNPSNPYFGKGDPIIDFSHQHVVRAFLTPVFGDVIAPGNTGPGGNQCFSYGITIPAAWKPAKLNAVAIVNGYGAGADGKPILNVQSTPLGEGVSWAE